MYIKKCIKLSKRELKSEYKVLFDYFAADAFVH